MDLKQYEYYRTDLGVLYHADGLEIMPLLEPVDLVLTDPPYGIGESNKKIFLVENGLNQKIMVNIIGISKRLAMNTFCRL